VSIVSEIAVALFFAANFMYCAAYMFKNMLWLRSLSVIAACMTFPYFYFQHEVLYSALFWQCAFAATNLYGIALLLLARRPVDLSEDQQHLKNMVFRNFTPRETKRLLTAAEWHSAQPGERLIGKGQTLPCLYLLHSGSVAISVDEKPIAHRGPGSFLGELHYMTGQLTMADVTFSVGSRYVCWRADELSRILNQDRDLKTSFESLLAVNVATKLGSR